MDKRTCVVLMVFAALFLQLATDVTGTAMDKTRVPLPTPPPMTTLNKKWCILRPNVPDSKMQANIDLACSKGVDCKSIKPGGACFNNKNLRSRASYAMNAYFRLNGGQDAQCSFSDTGAVVVTDPSVGACTYL